MWCDAVEFISHGKRFNICRSKFLLKYKASLKSVRQLKAYRLAKYGKVATRRFSITNLILFDVCTASCSNSPVHTSEDCLFSA